MADNSDPQVRVVDRRWWAQADADQSGGDADRGSRKPTYVEELEQRLGEATAQLQAFALEHRRALEEFDQARARIRRDVSREVERARRAVLADLLEVVDNLDRAIDAAQGEASQLLRGVRLVRDHFLSKLEALGVARVEALGRTFDANLHEAISTARVDDPSRDGIIVAVVREGYAIGDELLRPASVVVGARE